MIYDPDNHGKTDNFIQDFERLLTLSSKIIDQALWQERTKLLSRLNEAEQRAARAEEELLRVRQAATYDDLTGLLNRTGFEKAFLQRMEFVKRYGADGDIQTAILVLDLDGFKAINDTFGHASGDQALKIFAEKITGTLRNTDHVARWGGDEFIVLLCYDKGEHFDLDGVTRRIRTMLNGVVFKDEQGKAYPLGVSIGAFCFDSDEVVNPACEKMRNRMISYADLAMYEDKKLKMQRAKGKIVSMPMRPRGKYNDNLLSTH